eukprot:6213795-Pleurochrysis_carterae.AAC.3
MNTCLQIVRMAHKLGVVAAAVPGNAKKGAARRTPTLLSPPLRRLRADKGTCTFNHDVTNPGGQHHCDLRWPGPLPERVLKSARQLVEKIRTARAANARKLKVTAIPIGSAPVTDESCGLGFGDEVYSDMVPAACAVTEDGGLEDQGLYEDASDLDSSLVLMSPSNERVDEDASSQAAVMAESDQGNGRGAAARTAV